MRRLEFVIALVLAAGGIRSIVHHARRPFDSMETRDQLLYAAYLTGRVGMWFAFAGLFFILAFAGTTDPITRTNAPPSTGQVYIDDVSQYRWYVIVFAVLGGMQLLGGWFLGHRGSGSRDDADGPTRPP